MLKIQELKANLKNYILFKLINIKQIIPLHFLTYFNFFILFYKNLVDL
jgi:hypothetical protein